MDDPFLDDPLPREYVLYLRPSGPLLQQLSLFWQQSRVSCGKNKAHNIFPHITLCQFFMVSVDWLKTWQHHTFDFKVFHNFSTFYRSSIYGTSHICIHVICQNSTCWPPGECAVAITWVSKKWDICSIFDNSWIHFSLLSVWWWEGRGPVWCSPGHHGQVEGSYTSAGPTGALLVLHLHRPLRGGAGCRVAEGLRCRLCLWSGG